MKWDNLARKELPSTKAYKYPNAKAILRPDAGVQSQFRKKKPPKTYRYDSSLSPALDWDENPARELGEWLIHCIEQASRLEQPHRFAKIQEFKDAAGNVVATVGGLHDAVEQLKRLSRPFLNWAGKAERLSFEVPTLPLFIHERLSTGAILETIKGHKRDKQLTLFDLFADREHPIHDQLLRAYEHANGWVNRMILGDSLIVMNSLLQYEGMGGQVQMIYMDPPYGVKFGSNFQPFVRPEREIKHNNDEDMTREPEMVKAYRDTWELGLHSYLTYLRERLLQCRELLASTGSIFVQINDDNIHHVREVMEDVFGANNQCATIAWKKASPDTNTIRNVFNYLLWFAKDKNQTRVNKLFKRRSGNEGSTEDPRKLALWADFPNKKTRPLTTEEKRNISALPEGIRVFRVDKIVNNGDKNYFGFTFEGREIWPKSGYEWRGDPTEMTRLRDANRIIITPEGLGYKFYLA